MEARTNGGRQLHAKVMADAVSGDRYIASSVMQKALRRADAEVAYALGKNIPVIRLKLQVSKSYVRFSLPEWDQIEALRTTGAGWTNTVRSDCKYWHAPLSR